jgi:hypothetical protein
MLWMASADHAAPSFADGECIGVCLVAEATTARERRTICTAHGYVRQSVVFIKDSSVEWRLGVKV